MPLDQRLLDCAAYLFPTEVDAQYANEKGASGFLVGIPASSYWVLDRPCPQADYNHLYAVTSRHVIYRKGFNPTWLPSPIVRLNTDHEPRTVTRGDFDWICSTEHDIAAAPIRWDPAYRSRFIDISAFLTREIMCAHEIGHNDPVVLIGRFLRQDARKENCPAVLNGHLSLMPQMLPHPSNDSATQDSFGVTMLTSPGYSGSPVFVRLEPGVKYDLIPSPQYLERTTSNTHTLCSSGSINFESTRRVLPGGPWLLGVDWGFVHATEHDTKINTGMTGVVPAWHLREHLLNDLRCIDSRRKEQEELVARYG